MKNLIILAIFLSPILIVSGNSQAISYQTEIMVFGNLVFGGTAEWNIGTDAPSFGFCTIGTNTMSFCINEGSNNYDSDNSYIVSDTNQVVYSVLVFDGLDEYINSNETTIDLISWSVVARQESLGNTTNLLMSATIIDDIGLGQPECYDIYSVNNGTSSLTTSYSILSTPFISNCSGVSLNQTNLRFLTVGITAFCVSYPCSYLIRITALYATIIWHDNAFIPPTFILSNIDIVILFFLAIVWIVFFLLGCYIPSGIFCILGSFAGLVLMLLYILPFGNNIVTLVITGMVICCFIIGAGLAIQGDA